MDINIKFRIKKFNYVIGHGLVLSKEIYNRIGGFSEDEINEDNVLGYKLSMEKINIFPLPLLEKIDFAHNLKIYIKQQSVWFNGPLYAFKYFFKMKKGCNSKRTFNLFFMACQNFKNALNWMALSYLTVFSIIYTIFVKKISILLLLISLLLGYVVGINSLSERLLIKTGYLVKKSKFNITHLLVEIIFWLFIHSFGPIITIYKIIKGTNNQKNKYKTEKI